MIEAMELHLFDLLLKAVHLHFTRKIRRSKWLADSQRRSLEGKNDLIGEVPSYLVVYPTVVGVFSDSNACTSFHLRWSIWGWVKTWYR